MGHLDDGDRQALDLARYLLGKPVSTARLAKIQEVEHSLAWLIEGIPISPEAEALRQEDIRLFTPE